MHILKKAMLAGMLLSVTSSAAIVDESHAMGFFNNGYLRDNLVSNDTS